MSVDFRDVLAISGAGAMAVGGWMLAPGVGLALVGFVLYTFAVWRMA